MRAGAPRRSRRRKQDTELRRALRGLADRLDGADLSRVGLAVVDLLHAVVRRHLARGTRIPQDASALAGEAAGVQLDVQPPH